MAQTEASVRALLWQVDRRMEREGWDEPPSLFLVFRDPVVAEDIFAELFTLIPFPAWYELGARMPDPSAFTVLEAMTRLISRVPQDQMPPAFREILGLVISTEMFMVKQYRETPVASAQQAIDEYQGPLPEDHPDRIEGRMIVASMVDGSSDTLFRERDGEADISGDDTFELGGRLMDSLAELVTLVSGLETA